jgi:uncharacterized protein involved in exopolysaccharide biosynthesis
MAMVQTNHFGHERQVDIFAIDFLGTIRRRKWIGLLVAFLGFCGALAGALLWPATYSSTATILIEEPDVPSDLVKSTVSTYADERLQVIQQRVMTTQNLSDIIDRFGLYADALATVPRSQLVNALRSRIDFEVVSADLAGQQKNSQRPLATIAFTVSYDDPDPRVAQQVASRLTDLYLAENVQSRQEKAAGTTEFLGQQSKKLLDDMQMIEQKITQFRSTNGGSLPEQMQINMQILAQVQNQLMQNRRDFQALQEKKSFLQSQLAEISPYLPMTEQGRPATPQAQLMSLELQYVDLSAKYGPKHPDVVHLQKQIDSLKQQLGSSDAAPAAQQQLSRLQAQLADALQRYGEQHPQVQKLRKQIADLTADLAKSPQQAMITAPKGPPDSPVYIQLQNQMGDVNAQLQGLNTETAELQTKLDDQQARVLKTPVLEGEYNSLQQQYDAAVKRYQDFKDKEADAQVAQTMEQQSKSETFSVIEAPELPDLPIKPNRKLLLAAGVVLSCLLAATTMIGLEMLDSRLYEGRGLQLAFGEAPLAVVPYITTRVERRNRRLKMAVIALLIVGVIGGGLAIFDAFVMPLNVLATAVAYRSNALTQGTEDEQPTPGSNPTQGETAPAPAATATEPATAQ